VTKAEYGVVPTLSGGSQRQVREVGVLVEEKAVDKSSIDDFSIDDSRS
jgi:hypothetical protein